VQFGGPPPTLSQSTKRELQQLGHPPPPALFGVGYAAVDHALHLTSESKPVHEHSSDLRRIQDKIVELDHQAMLRELWWLLPLAFLKPLLTSLSLGGGGSGGIFAPSLFIGATTGAVIGLICNLLIPDWSANPGAYAIVGMGAVVAGTTHGILSAVLIVYEMTDSYEIILPIMAAAGISSVIAQLIDHESIYYKKLSRRGEQLARGHDMHRIEHIMVRDVMIRSFPTVRNTDSAAELIRVARSNSHIESLPVMNEANQMVGIIRPEDLHRVLDTDVPLHVLNADDIAMRSPPSVSPDANLLEALRDFGSRDVEMLPVECESGNQRQLVGILLRSEVMRRYRMELLRRQI
jgi:CIC family chloride channel protein